MRVRRKDACANCQRLQQHVSALHAQLATLQDTVRQLQEELARLRKDSSTSSKPPSSDLVKPPKPPPPPEQAQRSAGGQPGHPHHQRPLLPPE
jgi:transposase